MINLTGEYNMRYTRLYLKGYKPLSYGGIKEINITDIPQVVIVSGENGKGKSSLLRELSPYPAARPDYDKKGVKIIEIEHDGCYVLTSDFSKPQAHSFKKNDIEYNLSGTVEVQQDLIQQHFSGFTPLVEKIVSGQCRFSQMSKQERKQVIMATYPTSLLFILDKYKALTSKIRAKQNQLKLLNERKIVLKESFISDDILERHNNERHKLNKLMSSLDKEVYALNTHLQPLLDSVKDNLPYELSSCEEFTNMFNKFYDEYKLLIQQGLDIDADQVDEVLAYQKVYMTNIKDNIQTLTEQGKTLAEEINKYHICLTTDKNDLIRECEQQIEEQEDIIDSCTIIDDVPVVDKITITKMKEYSSSLRQHLDTLRSMDIEHWELDKYAEEERRFRKLQDDKNNYERELASLQNQMDQLIDRLDKYTDKTYPADCRHVCSLRDNVKHIVDNLKSDMTKISQKIDDTANMLNVCSSALSACHMGLEARSTAKPIIEHLERMFSRVSWGTYICSDTSLVRAINNNVLEIYNRYVRIIKKSSSHLKVKEAEQKLNQLVVKLQTLKTEEQPAKQILADTLMAKERELEKVTEKLSNYKTAVKSIELRYNTYNTYKSLLTNLLATKDKWEHLRQVLSTQATIEYISGCIQDMENIKATIGEKLRDLDGIVKEQEALRIRLNSEIEPVISQLNNELSKWELIEQQLSPTTGIPHIHLVKYINSLFIKANKFIKRVWNYSMELAYLSEQEPCDYTFKVLINGDGIVKDINTCSKGQKEIIDLALILAICTYGRQYALEFPIKLDEMTSGLSPDHSSRLFEYLGELFGENKIMQTYIVNHDPIVTSGYEHAGYIALSKDQPLPTNCNIISDIA